MPPFFKFRNPLRPFAPLPLVSAQWYSPLDAKAEAAGVPLVEKAFAECPPLAVLAGLLGRLVGDRARGELALKKALHGAFEARLRTLALWADPPESYGFGLIPQQSDRHPLDSRLAEGIELSVPPVGFVEQIWHRIELIALAIALVGRAAWIGLRFGKFRVTPRPCRMLALNAWPESRWLAINSALVEHAGFKPGDLVAEVHSSASSEFTILPIVRPATLPVEIAPWLTKAVLGSIRVAIGALSAGLRSGKDPRVTEGAIQSLRLANRTLDSRRLSGAVHFDICVDDTEYDPRHILIGALAPHAQMVRLPHSEMNTFGVSLSYLGYDIFLSSGTYQSEFFSRTWRTGTRAVAVGMLQNDRRIRSPMNVDAGYRAAIEAELAKGRRMAVIFGPSAIPGIWPLFLRQLDIVLDAAAAHDDWFVVVKPKVMDRLYAEAGKNPDLAGRLQSDRVICLRYPIAGHEVCSTGYLFDKMTLGVSAGGSVTIEALCRGRNTLVWYPVFVETPLHRKLYELGLFHTAEHSFRNALNAFMDNPQKRIVPFSWFQEKFDPFRDDRALDRFAAALYPPPDETARSSSVIVMPQPTRVS